MKKIGILVLGIVAALCVQVQASVEQTFAGNFRVQGVSSVNAAHKPVDNSRLQTLIDSRLSLRFINSLNEKQGFVWHGEIDGIFGGSGYSQQGGGATDVIETRNLYGYFSLADWKVKVGLIGVADQVDQLLFDDDVSGIIATSETDERRVSLIYNKVTEGDKEADIDGDGKDDDASSFYTDDVDTLGIQYQKSFDSLSVAYDIYYTRDQREQESEVEQQSVGIKLSNLNVGFANIDATFAYEGGTANVYNSSKVFQDDTESISAWLVAIKTNGEKGGFRFVYSPADNKSNSDKTFNGATSDSTFWQEGLNIFLGDSYANGAGNGGRAVIDSLQSGYGLIAATYSGMSEIDGASYVKYAAGYFMAAGDEVNEDSTTKVEGKNLGAEISCMVGGKIDDIDLSLRGSYALLGDFYDDADGGGPGSAFFLSFMMNMNF